MRAGPGDQFGVRGRGVLLQVARSGKAHAVGVAHRAEGHPRGDPLGDIDQHQRDQNFRRAEPVPEHRGDHAPSPAPGQSRRDHQRKQPPRLQRVQRQRHGGAGQAADDVLSLGPDVPDARAKADGQARRNQDQGCGLDQQLRPGIAGGGAEQRVPEDRADRRDRVMAQQREQQPAGDHGGQHGHHRRRDLPAGRGALAGDQRDHRCASSMPCAPPSIRPMRSSVSPSVGTGGDRRPSFRAQKRSDSSKSSSRS